MGPWDCGPKDDYTLYGDYAFGHFLMCFDSVKGFTKECQEAQCHMDPGAYGTSADWSLGFLEASNLV